MMSSLFSKQRERPCFGGHGTGPKMHCSGTWPAKLFRGTILVWRGTSSDLGGLGPEMPLVARTWVWGTSLVPPAVLISF